MNKINVAIADDNQRTVEMMTELLEQESDIEVIASADDGEEALRIIKEKQPDVVLDVYKRQIQVFQCVRYKK